MPDLLQVVLREYRERRGYSRADLSALTVRLGYQGVPEKTIQAIESSPGRVPEAETIEALAAALEIDPSVLALHEWPIAKARRDFKEKAGQPRQRRGPKPLEAREDGTGTK